MVNKFGDDTPDGFGLSVDLIKKIQIIKGKFGDYCNEIITSYRLGFTPYRKTQHLTIPVYVYNDRVFSHGGLCCSKDDHFQHRIGDHIGQVCAAETITDKIISKDGDILVIFKRGDINNNNVIAIKGDDGEMGGQGPPGARGSKGEVGKDGLLTLVDWFSPQVVKWYREIEKVAFYFDDEKSGFIVDGDKKKIGLKNHSTGENAMAKYKVEQLIEIPTFDTFALRFSKSLYRIQNINWALSGHMKAILVISFKIDKFPNDFEYICGTENKERGLSLKGANLQIWRNKDQCINTTYILGKWNIVYVEWNTNGSLSYYSVNGKEGTFKTEPVVNEPEILYLGASKGGKNFFDGCLSVFDLYSNMREDSGNLPAYIKKLMIQTHTDRIPID